MRTRRRGRSTSASDDPLASLGDLLADAADDGLRITVTGPLPHAAAYRLMDALGVEVVELTQAERGAAAVDFRASLASQSRRIERGETPELCDHCRTETDVTFPAHDPRCPNFPRRTARRRPADEDPGERVKIDGVYGTTAAHAKDGSLTSSEMRRRQKTQQAEVPMRVECAVIDCEWWYEGPAKIAMAMQTDHRDSVHGRGGHERPGRSSPAVEPFADADLDAGEPDDSLIESMDHPGVSGSSARGAIPATVEGGVGHEEPPGGSGSLPERPASAPPSEALAGQPDPRKLKVSEGGWSRAPVNPDVAKAALRAKAEELGRTPTGLEWKKAGWRPAYSTMMRLFGGWKAACVEAGLEAISTPQRTGEKKWDAPAILDAFERWAAAHDGAPPKADDWLHGPLNGEWPHTQAVTREFGTWREATKAAGFAARGRGGQPGNSNAERQQVPIVWHVKVPGTGLRYRSVDEALVAAAEIEHDGETVARQARVAGQEGKADQAIDASRELAAKIREACGVVDNLSTDSPAIAVPEPDPAAKSTQIGDSVSPTRRSDAELVAAAVDAGPDEKDAWIERMRAEARRLEVRAAAFTQIADGLTVLKETE